jgi:hypothetical protein
VQFHVPSCAVRISAELQKAPNELKTVKIETATVTSLNGGNFPSLVPGTTCLLPHLAFLNFYFETNLTSCIWKNSVKVVCTKFIK